MGLFDSKSYTTSSQEDNRIAAEKSQVYQIQGVGGDVIMSDLGALALGEKGLNLAGQIAAQSLTAQTTALEAGRGELDSVINRIMGAAVPIAIVVAIAWAFKK